MKRQIITLVTVITLMIITFGSCTEPTTKKVYKKDYYVEKQVTYLEDELLPRIEFIYHYTLYSDDFYMVRVSREKFNIIEEGDSLTAYWYLTR